MTVQAIGLLGMGCLVSLIFLRVPVGVAMGLVGLCGYAAVDGWVKAFRVFGEVPFDVASNYSLSVVPMFVLMGELATQSGMSSQLYKAAKALFAGARGSQVLATIGACAGFGAVCGSSLATAATMTRIAIPEMRRAGYDDRISTGSVAAGGSLGILLPPSIVFVIYSLISQQSVQKMFAAGLIPGIILAGLYMLAALATLAIKPAWAPREPAAPLKERVRDLVLGWEVALLFGVAIGGLYAGWFSPTEAAGVGAFTAFVLGTLRRGLPPAVLWNCFRDTIRTTCLLFVIVMSAFIFSYFVVQTQLPGMLVTWVTAWHVGPIELVAILIVFYVVMGCFLDGGGMILITVPIFLPLVTQYGFDPVWFGVMLVVTVEMGLIHPPVGMNIFVIQARAPDIPILRIYQGIIPFLFAPLMLLVLLIAFPQIALWLPTWLYG
ncbi:MAG TPA: TRAP transporter large permease [Stellaceae bacterium]|nr:TRAP transporter large permease [Stellaceae bacterium]